MIIIVPILIFILSMWGISDILSKKILDIDKPVSFMFGCTYLCILMASGILSGLMVLSILEGMINMFKI